MLGISKEEILSQKIKIRQDMEIEIFQSMDNSIGWMNLILPKAVIVLKEGQQKKSILLEKVIVQRIDAYKKMVRKLFQAAIDFDEKSEDSEVEISAQSIPVDVASRIVYAVLKIISCGIEINDSVLYFIDNIGSVLGLDPFTIGKAIEKVKYESRDEFTQIILNNFSERHCYWCALMLWKAIHIDGVIHPNEYIYFDNIIKLLRDDPAKLLQLQHDSEYIKFIFEPVSPQLAELIFKYIVEIVMCDGKFVHEESEFIKEVGKAFGYDTTQQDEIIQPVASAYMVQNSLFPIENKGKSFLIDVADTQEEPGGAD